MWLFTKYGFFSVVANTTWHNNLKIEDPDNFVVRARCREHLQSLIWAFDEDFGGQPILSNCQITESTDSDYQFRIVVLRETWINVVADLAHQVDYTNFKQAVKEYESCKVPSEYEKALMVVWKTMSGIQPLPPYSQNLHDRFPPIHKIKTKKKAKRTKTKPSSKQRGKPYSSKLGRS